MLALKINIYYISDIIFISESQGIEGHMISKWQSQSLNL